MSHTTNRKKIALFSPRIARNSKTSLEVLPVVDIIDESLINLVINLEHLSFQI